MSRAAALVAAGMTVGFAGCADCGRQPIIRDSSSPVHVRPAGGTCSPAAGGLDYVSPCPAGVPLAEPFVPANEWDYFAPEPYRGYVVASPVAANLTDDNGDAAIDMCDVPDVVLVTTTGQSLEPAVLHLVSGNDGAALGRFSFVDAAITPAIGDLDNDGAPEIVAADNAGRLVVLGADLQPRLFSDAGIYGSPLPPHHGSTCTGIALSDLEGDGSIEILVAQSVYEADGKLRFRADPALTQLNGEDVCFFPQAFDLDDDGAQEVLLGNLVYAPTGQLLWAGSDREATPHVLDADGDGTAEVLMINALGLELFTASGTSLWGPVKPVDASIPSACWLRALAVDAAPGQARVALTTCAGVHGLSVTTAGPEVLWSLTQADVVQPVLGLGGAGVPALFPSSPGLPSMVLAPTDSGLYGVDIASGDVRLELPDPAVGDHVIVLDVDNDGSPEILVTGNDAALDGSVPQLRVYGDAAGRVLPTRRIWNQHAYRVGGIREDAIIARERTGAGFRAQASRSCSN